MWAKLTVFVIVILLQKYPGECSKDKTSPKCTPQTQQSDQTKQGPPTFNGPPPEGQMQFDPMDQGPPPPTNCKEIHKLSPESLSGMFIIGTKGGPLQVYCDMTLEGGGWTFLPRFAVRSDNFVGIDLDKIVSDKSKVLLRFATRSGTQPYTLIEQLPENKKMEFGIFKNHHKGFSKPKNEKLGSYLYLGILPEKEASKKTKQGFLSNGKEITFENCDGKSNSHFAFIPNHYDKDPSDFMADDDKFEKSGVAVDWRATGKRVSSFREMPNDFYYFTEINFGGGCGCYTSSDRWNDALGVAIGFR